ncbi:hypothetical protein EV191_1097 [Tamaricihabitans halophyticus]|uniref:N-acetyltransferase domain-containing protein n=1 Tax=Tamaricihabitans halophyticus TaxID=1262583 RepID=A0A4R2QQ86_9PSEU|nr:GNAT family N-acetyltransferase [Tamaricihabitans halophyticus]TCP49185.1 hypothetical protein EV191_1097 [Tamaricihabitans halophyticus]
MLRLAGARLLDERDSAAVHAALAADPVGTCMVGARVEAAGLAPTRLGGELWGVDTRGGKVAGLCFSGPNLIPLSGNQTVIRGFADRALRRRRICSSLVGPAEQVIGLWEALEPEWGPAREVRAEQPVLATTRRARVPADSLVRQVRIEELDAYLPAAIAMFIEEVGIDPCAGDGGVGYRARVAELISSGRAFARYEHGELVFKAEIGALSSKVGQIQGVWVHPAHRGQGLGTAGTAAVVNHLVVRLNRAASLYVNAYNAPALAAYQKIGFQRAGSYATILF